MRVFKIRMKKMSSGSVFTDDSSFCFLLFQRAEGTLLFDGFTAFFKLDLCDLRSAALVLTPFAAVADTNIVAAILLLRVRKNKKKRGVI